MCLFVSLSWGRGQGEGELGSSVLYVFFVVKSGLKRFPPCEALIKLSATITAKTSGVDAGHRIPPFALRPSPLPLPANAHHKAKCFPALTRNRQSYTAGKVRLIMSGLPKIQMAWIPASIPEPPVA
jgi:hypothetical protein